MTYRPVVDVHLILERSDDGEVLLAERANTGDADGLVNVPAANWGTARTCVLRRSERPRRRSGSTSIPATCTASP